MTPQERQRIVDQLNKLRDVSWKVGLTLGAIFGIFSSAVYAGIENIESYDVIPVMGMGAAGGILVTGLVYSFIERRAVKELTDQNKK